MAQDDNGGQGDDRESTVDPRCAGHPPAVVREPVVDFTDGARPRVLTSAVCRRDDGQWPSDDGKNSGDRARESEHDHPEPRPGAGCNVEVGDAHAQEAIERAQRSFHSGTPLSPGSMSVS
ncbi:MAG: hypothetical protein K0S37_4394, partial [Microbacterium sp.]|nr:hypothetical protein [Microbacterium sp.]